MTTTTRFLSFSGLLCMFMIQACQQKPAIVQTGWPMYSADPTGSKYSSLNQINRNSVKDLKLAWKFHTGDARKSPATTIQCNPIIVDERIYLTSPGMKLICLNASDGEEVWRFDPYEGQISGGVNRGVTYWSAGDDKRIFYVAGAWLYAINATSGELVPSFGTEGKVDLYEGLDRDVRNMWVTAATPGIIYKDLLILGSTLGDGPNGNVPGYIRAYNVRTGRLSWTFRTIPQPGEFGYDTWPEDAWTRKGGANSWGGFTLDANRGIVFCGTGSPSYDHWGGDRIGTNLFGNCILALNAETGERIWHFQVVHHDIWDYDIPCPPNLVQVERDGKIIDAIAQPTKMGHLFVLNRETGEPIYPVEEVSVPKSQIPGEESWPTQPFPPQSLRYAQQRLTESEYTDLSPEATADIKAKLKGKQLGDIFLPPSFEGAVTLPQFNGGSEWGGAAYDPITRHLYLNSSNELEWISMVEARPPDNISLYQFGQRLYGTYCAACHGYGNPRNPGSPALSQIKDLRTKEEVLQQLMEGKGQMPSFTFLSEQERNALIAYLWDEGKEVQLNAEVFKPSLSADIPFLSTGHNEIKDPEGFPANKRPWGTLTSINLDEGRIVWQVPLGTYPELEKRGLDPTGTFNIGGLLVTAGGLVFVGASMDERFHAFDTETGEMLWEFQMDAGGYATPATFEVNGKQYVIIAGGGGGKPGTKAGDAYYCFALD